MSECSRDRRRRVLLVDDDPLVADLMSDVLTDAGCEVISLSSAEQALEYMEDAKSDLDAVISDFRLPGLTGLDVIERARKRWPRVIPIVLSGDVLDPKLLGLTAAGIKVLIKPVTSEILTLALAAGSD
jgi:CheY-like chemotaxis protein